MAQGKIVKLVYGGGFGFIRLSSQVDLFFHRSVVEGAEFDGLQEGQTVEFEERWDPNRSSFYAVRVRLLGPPSVPRSATSTGG